MHNTHNFNDVKPRLRVGSAIQEPSPHMCETVAASAARIHELLPAQDEPEHKLPRENRTMTKETCCAIRESSFFPRRTRLFPHKTSGLYPKSVASSSKISAFPRQILLSPEKSDVFWTVKVAILKCPKPGGFDSRCSNIFYFYFPGKLF